VSLQGPDFFQREVMTMGSEPQYVCSVGKCNSVAVAVSDGCRTCAVHADAWTGRARLKPRAQRVTSPVEAMHAAVTVFDRLIVTPREVLEAFVASLPEEQRKRVTVGPCSPTPGVASCMLVDGQHVGGELFDGCDIDAAIEALREALAKPPEPQTRTEIIKAHCKGRYGVTIESRRGVLGEHQFGVLVRGEFVHKTNWNPGCDDDPGSDHTAEAICARIDAALARQERPAVGSVHPWEVARADMATHPEARWDKAKYLHGNDYAHKTSGFRVIGNALQLWLPAPDRRWQTRDDQYPERDEWQRLRDQCETFGAGPTPAEAMHAAVTVFDDDAPNLQEQIRACGAEPSEVRPAWLIRELRTQIAKVTAERDRLRKLFDDAGQGEHNVLALIDHYQQSALDADTECAAWKGRAMMLRRTCDEAQDTLEAVRKAVGHE